MESRTGNLLDQKRKIFEYIEVNGPSLPMKISSYFKRDSIIISAFLSELLSDKELAISRLRVGNSPLYYIRGQEFQLENFSQYLGNKEKEAFELLKEKKVLADENLLPAIRVALRSINDFAFPMQYGDKLYWRYLRISDQSAIDLLEIAKKAAKKIEEKQKEERVIEEKPKELIERGLGTQEVTEQLRVKGVEIGKRRTEFIEPKKQEAGQQEKGAREEEKPLLSLKKLKKGKLVAKSDFVFDVEEFLEKNDFIVEREIDFKKKEYNAYIKVDSQLGKIKMLCMAREKKAINDNDLTVALQKANEEKLPVLLITKGEPNKKAMRKLEEVGNLVFWKVLG